MYLKNFRKIVIGLALYLCLSIFLFLKHNLYDAVLTDTAAIFLGMLSLYFFAQKKYILLATTIIPAYFTWPISLLLIVPLLLFTKPAFN